MLLISYDISDTKVRTKFSEFIKKYGYRIQYSVYQIKNSERILEVISAKIDQLFLPKFSETDSVYIFNMSKNCRIKSFGYARQS